MRPEDHKSEVSLSYIVRDCLKKSHPTLDMTAQDLNPSAQKAEAAASVPLRSGRSSQWRLVKGHLKASHFLHSWGWPWTPSLVSPSQGQGCRWVSVTTLGSLEIFKLHLYDRHTLYLSHFFLLQNSHPPDRLSDDPSSLCLLSCHTSCASQSRHCLPPIPTHHHDSCPSWWQSFGDKWHNPKPSRIQMSTEKRISNEDEDRTRERPA